MDTKDLQAIHDEIWAQIYERQIRALEQKLESTHSDMNLTSLMIEQQSGELDDPKCSQGS